MNKQEKYNNLIELIDKAGGPKLPNVKNLTFTEKMKVTSNAWAFLFTIFYYLYIGCWKKGIVYLVVSILIIIAIENFIPSFSNMSWIITSVIFATRANIDIYKKNKLNDDEWF